MSLRTRLAALEDSIPIVDHRRSHIPTDPVEFAWAFVEGRLTADDFRHCGPEHVEAVTTFAALLGAVEDEDSP
jgi:hypothetical protein